MNNKFFSIVDYFVWIFNKYHEFQKQNMPLDTFRVIEIRHKKSGDCIVKVQIVGKANIFECSPEDIIKNDQLVEGFSRRDIRTLTYFATKDIKTPKYKILIQEFNEKLNKMIFKLGRKGLSKPVIKTATEISLEKELINQLDSEDAHLVGYTTALEMATLEKEEIEKLTNKTDQ